MNSIERYINNMLWVDNLILAIKNNYMRAEFVVDSKEREFILYKLVTYSSYKFGRNSIVTIANFQNRHTLIQKNYSTKNSNIYVLTDGDIRYIDFVCSNYLIRKEV